MDFRPPAATIYGRGKGKGGPPSRPVSSGGRGASSSSPSPQLLTANIKNSRSIEELCRNITSYGSHFNHIHLSACWISLGDLWGCDETAFPGGGLPAPVDPAGPRA